MNDSDPADIAAAILFLGFLLFTVGYGGIFAGWW